MIKKLQRFFNTSAAACPQLVIHAGGFGIKINRSNTGTEYRFGNLRKMRCQTAMNTRYGLYVASF